MSEQKLIAESRTFEQQMIERDKRATKAGFVVGGVGLLIAVLALVAVGGLGRRELLPYSDFDLLLVHDDGISPERVTAAAESIWYPLWDAHIKLDHSVRTVPPRVGRRTHRATYRSSSMREMDEIWPV